MPKYLPATFLEKKRFRTAGLIFLGGISIVIYVISSKSKGVSDLLDEDKLIRLQLKLNYESRKITFPITIITAFFTVGTSKHYNSQYERWMANFLPYVDTPMVIFTQPSQLELVAKLRKGRATHFLVYKSIWEVPWIKNASFSNNSSDTLHDKYQKMLENHDPEYYHHSPELYAIWNSKPWMMNYISNDINPFNSTYFYWMDIGSVRDRENLANFPSVDKAVQVFGRDEKAKNFKKFQVFSIHAFHNYKSPPESNTFEDVSHINFIIGGFFGGTKMGIEWFSSTFYKTHNELMDLGYFVGKDQSIYNWIATQYPQKMMIVCSCLQQNWDDLGCGDVWFYFRKWYSGESEGESCDSSPLKDMGQFLLEQVGAHSSTGQIPSFNFGKFIYLVMLFNVLVS